MSDFFKKIPKFVINLQRRPDRLEEITREMRYLGWDFELFHAIDTNSYMGCALSHLKIIEIAKKNNYRDVLIIEDDCYVMPYAKSLLTNIENDISNSEYFVINLSPTLNRHLTVSKHSKYFLDLTKLPNKSREDLRETYATNMILYNEKIYDKIMEIQDMKYPSGDFQYPIDEYLALKIYPNYQSYCPVLPIAPQRASNSDVSGGFYNNFYTQTYNWNLYSPIKIPNEYLSTDNLIKLKSELIHLQYV